MTARPSSMSRRENTSPMRPRPTTPTGLFTSLSTVIPGPRTARSPESITTILAVGEDRVYSMRQGLWIRWRDIAHDQRRRDRARALGSDDARLRARQERADPLRA